MTDYFKVVLDRHKISGFKRAYGVAAELSKAQRKALDAMFGAFNISAVVLSFKGTDTAVIYEEVTP